jgi:hypothetical protein
VAITALSVAVWAHHMFATGAVLLAFFSLTTFLIAVPTGIKFVNWIGTMWRGQITFETPMLFAVGFLATFLLGCLTGILLASPPLDFHIHAARPGLHHLAQVALPRQTRSVEIVVAVHYGGSCDVCRVPSRRRPGASASPVPTRPDGGSRSDTMQLTMAQLRADARLDPVLEHRAAEHGGRRMEPASSRHGAPIRPLAHPARRRC